MGKESTDIPSSLLTIILIVPIIFSCQGCQTLKYVKEHPFKSLGYVAVASLIVVGATAQAYSQNSQSQNIQSPQPIQSAQAPYIYKNEDDPQIVYVKPGTTAQQIGSSTFYSDGTSAQQIGKTTFFSDGTTAQGIGSTTFYSNGETAQQIGKSTFYSDGTSSQQIGSTTFFSEGGTAQKIGSTVFTSE
jgi:hypothetical protein